MAYLLFGFHDLNEQQNFVGRQASCISRDDASIICSMAAILRQSDMIESTDVSLTFFL